MPFLPGESQRQGAEDARIACCEKSFAASGKEISRQGNRRFTFGDAGKFEAHALRGITRAKLVISGGIPRISSIVQRLPFHGFSFACGRKSRGECRTNETACSSLFQAAMREFPCVSFRSGNLWNLFSRPLKGWLARLKLRGAQSDMNRARFSRTRNKKQRARRNKIWEIRWRLFSVTW